MRPIGYLTYKHFAKKYNIKLTDKNNKPKPMKQLSAEIYSYETKNKFVRKGLYYF